MYRLPWYGQIALTAFASATLLNLNGLKSSFTCTGVFLRTTFPKKGLGTGGEVEELSGLVFGDEFADGPTAVFGEAGVNARAFGLGLKDVALTFSLFAATSAFAASAFLIDCALVPVPEGFGAACVALLDDCDGDFLPLNGGMDWMTILILAVLAAVAVGVLVATMEGLLTSFDIVEPVPETLPELDGTTLFVAVGVGGLAAGVALSAAVAPIARACVDEASLVDFSIIARCFSSSLARIFTRSSGIGLFNLKPWLNLSRSAMRFSLSLLTNAWRFWVNRCFSCVTNSRNAGSASAGGCTTYTVYNG